MNGPQLEAIARERDSRQQDSLHETQLLSSSPDEEGLWSALGIPNIVGHAKDFNLYFRQCQTSILA